MNWELLGIIGVWCLLIWCLVVITVTYVHWKSLSLMQQTFAEVHLTYEVAGTAVALVTLLVYYLG